MTACIGWKAEHPCPVYGDVHGCELEDGHNAGGAHICVCGATTRTRDLPIERAWSRHSPSGWMRHNARAEGGTSRVVRASARARSRSREAG